MGYQEECEWFAVHGDPMREAMEYEFNARYDYLREAYGSSVDAQSELDADDWAAEQEAREGRAGLIEHNPDFPDAGKPLGPPRPGDLVTDDVPF